MSSRSYKLHGLILAYHSDFFYKALALNFREKYVRRIDLNIDGIYYVLQAAQRAGELAIVDRE